MTLKQASKIQFNFQVKAYDMLTIRQASSLTRLLASKISSFAISEEENMCNVDTTLYFCMAVDIIKPLCHGITVNLEAESIWNYVEVYQTFFFFWLGLWEIAHILKSYKIIDPSIVKNNLQ